MRVARAHQPQVGDRIVDAALKPGRHAGRNLQRAQHHRHRAGEILAVPFSPREQEVRQRIGRFVIRQLQRVAEIRAQVALDGARPLQIVARPRRKAARQFRDPRVQRRQLQVRAARRQRQESEPG